MNNQLCGCLAAGVDSPQSAQNRWSSVKFVNGQLLSVCCAYGVLVQK